jgi:segregation and condensation protein A
VSVCTIRLPVFEGPPDLLLYLVEKRELEPASIEVAAVAAQYRAQLQAARRVDLDSASEVLVTVARLLALKARSLLPAGPPAGTAPSAGSEAAPARDGSPVVVQDIAQYRLFQLRAAGLGRLAEAQAARFARPPVAFETGTGYGGADQLALADDLSAWVLAAAYERAIARSWRQGRVVAAELLTVRRRMAELLKNLRSGGRALFSALCRGARSRRDIIVTFLALLELLRRRRITLTQPAPFADLAIGVRSGSGRRPVDAQ